MTDVKLALVGNLQKTLEAERAAVARGIRGGMEALTDLGKTRLRQQVTRAGLGDRLAKTWRNRVYPPGRGVTLEPAGVIWSNAPHIVRAFSEGSPIRSRELGGWLAIPTDLAPVSRKRGARRKRMPMSDFLDEFGTDSLRVFGAPGKGNRVLYAVADKGFVKGRGKRGGARQARHVEFGKAGRAVLQHHAAAHVADGLFQHDHGVLVVVGVAEPLAGQQDRGSNRRMACERKLFRRGENPQLGRVRRVFRRQHEHSLRQVELACDSLHPGVRQAFRVQNDRQRISRKGLIREDVEDVEPSCHRAHSPVSLVAVVAIVAMPERAGGQTVACRGRRCQRRTRLRARSSSTKG